MTFNYLEVERVHRISPDDFYRLYVKPQKPVVIEQLTHDWPAYEKWHFACIKEQADDEIVPLYGNDPADYNKKVNEPDTKMRMADYIDQLLSDKPSCGFFCTTS